MNQIQFRLTIYKMDISKAPIFSKPIFKIQSTASLFDEANFNMLEYHYEAFVNELQINKGMYIDKIKQALRPPDS